jgi:predicted ATPase/DNA-binding CsgD family transcriptional regulator
VTADIHGDLPPDRTPFVGRDAALETASGILRRWPILTLTGPAGVGKTRLALRVAARLQQHGPRLEGSWMLDVGALDAGGDYSPEQLYARIAVALRIRHVGPIVGPEAVLAHLRNRRILLIFDNSDLRLRETQSVVNTLLRAAPEVRILATSRQSLGVDGERVLIVDPLTVPDSAALFRDLALAAGVPKAALRSSAVEDVCLRLDGLPLAIELAARRARTLSLRELAKRLDDEDRFAVLTAPGPGGTEHRGLERVVELSYQQCTPEERRVWARASVFVGGFELAAAEEVTGADGVDVVKAVMGLVDKSVFTVSTDSTPARFRMLVTFREYGRRVLSSGEERQTRDRHCSYYATRTADAAATWFGPLELDTMAAVRHELPNILAAIDHALACGNFVVARAIPRDVTRCRAPFFWGFLDLALQQLTRVIAASENSLAGPDDVTDLADTMAAAAWIAASQGRPENSDALNESARELLAKHDLPATAATLFAAGASQALLYGSSEAVGLLAAAVQLFAGPDTSGDRQMADMMYAIISARTTDPAVAAARARAHLARAEDADAPWATSWGLWASAEVAKHHGDLEAATEYNARCLRSQRTMDDGWGPTWSLEQCAHIIAARLAEPDAVSHDPKAAEANRREARRAAWLLGAAHARHRRVGVVLTGLRPMAGDHEAAYRRIVRVLGEVPIAEEMAAGAEGNTAAFPIALGEPTPRRPSADSATTLTDRERQVVELAVQGHSNREVASILQLSTRTVETHLRNAYAKLNVNNRVALVTMWAAHLAASG